MKAVLYAALLAGSVVATSQSVRALEDLPDGFWLVSVSNKSDSNLNAARVACAFGDIPKIVKRLKQEKVKTQIVVENYCPAVVAEAAKRGNHSDLYSRMQHEKAPNEMKIILVAAAKGQRVYINAEGQQRDLTCQLAFDMGYIYGNANPEEPILVNSSDAELNRIVKRCYEGLVEESIKNTFWTAARLAQKQNTK